MAISFGIAKKIIDHPSYNLSLALPFVCAFYVLNTPATLTIPVLGGHVNAEITALLYIIGVTTFYVMSLYTFVLAGCISKAVGESKGWLFLVAFFGILSLSSFFDDSNFPRIGIFFGTLSAVYLLLVALKMENGSLSLLLVTLSGGILSLLSFVLGILWFDGHYLFLDVIAKIFGLEKVVPESLKIGSIMLITSGYVIFYAVFETDELWSD